MNVLIACEESQVVCAAFRELGHNAFSCDIQECSGGHPEWHLKYDVLQLLDKQFICFSCDGKKHYIENWDLIIAHPPCTYLTNAAARWLYSGGVLNESRYQKGLAAREFFMKFYNFDCCRVCIENPMPSKIFNLPEPDCIIQPYYFGEPYSKKTYLWLKGLPPLVPTDVLTEFQPYIPSSCSHFRGTSHNKNTVHGSKLRSKTFLGIAKAMAAQWGSCTNEYT